jgi:hypothetical protein
MKHLFTLVLSITVLSIGALAQDGTFSASLDRTTVGAGEQFALSFTVSGSDMNSVKNLRPPSFSSFVVMSGPNQSTNMQIVNGQVSASATFTYYLYARQTGKYTIGSASIEYRGATLRTLPLQIEVIQGKPQTQAKEADAVQGVAENLFIRATADKQRVKQGEPVTVTYRLYTRLNVSGYDIAKAPVYQGFWAEEIEQPKQPTVTAETYEGKQFRVAMIRKSALFPTQSGRLTISPLEVRCAFQMPSKRKSNDPFDSFFNDPFFARTQSTEQEFKSNTLSVTVDPLPGNAPAGYSGAVGRFTFNAMVDSKEVKTGDPITLRLTITGTGNVKLLTPPKPTLPADFEAYEPKISEEITRDGGVIKGKKVAEYLVIPRNAGARSIEPVVFSYFDLDRNAYTQLRSPRFDFTILPGKDMSAGAMVASKSDVRLLGEDIRYLKLSLGEITQIDASPFSGGWFAAFMILPPLAFLGAFGYRKRSEKLSGKVDVLRAAKAGREAAKRLKQAKKLLSQGNTESYHAEISKALMEYLGDKLRIQKSELTMDDASAQLAEGGVPVETLQLLRSCIERAEFARFAPASDTQEARTELLDTAAGIIGAVEKSYSGKR